MPKILIDYSEYTRLIEIEKHYNSKVNSKKETSSEVPKNSVHFGEGAVAQGLANVQEAIRKNSDPFINPVAAPVENVQVEAPQPKNVIHKVTKNDSGEGIILSNTDLAKKNNETVLGKVSSKSKKKTKKTPKKSKKAKNHTKSKKFYFIGLTD